MLIRAEDHVAQSRLASQRYWCALCAVDAPCAMIAAKRTEGCGHALAGATDPDPGNAHPSSSTTDPDPSSSHPPSSTTTDADPSYPHPPTGPTDADPCPCRTDTHATTSHPQPRGADAGAYRPHPHADPNSPDGARAHSPCPDPRCATSAALSIDLLYPAWSWNMHPIQLTFPVSATSSHELAPHDCPCS